MGKLSFVFALLLLFSCALLAQVSVSKDNSDPDPSAMLDVRATDKGALLPRMTREQISTISNPANGLLVFCATDNKFYAYITSANAWREIPFGTGIIAQSFTCGTSLTINHVAGSVAPVTKTATYGTVTNIPGEPTKCWITSNLGADHQAAAVNDATEASAGWYWQFNRKQGYKHDGTTRTPNTTWIEPIIEDLDWQSANDPCTLELGAEWRIPTSTEWINVDASGGWNDWTGPWNSALKLHAAGYLYDGNGSLFQSGLFGEYCTSRQSSTIYSGHLYFHSSYCGIDSDVKAHGFTIRCLRNN